MTENTNPPVSEVGFTVQFPPAAEASVLDGTSFFERFKDRFPVFQQVPKTPPIIVPQIGEPGDPFPNQLQQPFSFLPGPVPVIPRLWAISSDSKKLVQFQSDRFSFNWRRIVPLEEPSNYPGFVDLHSEFHGLYREFSDWYSGRFSQPPKPDVAELLYANTVSLSAGDSKRRLSEVYKFFKPTRRKAVGNFNVNWVEKIDGETPGAIDMRAVAGRLPDGVDAAHSMFVARVSLGETLPERWFVNAHDAVLELYDGVIISGGKGTSE